MLPPVDVMCTVSLPLLLLPLLTTATPASSASEAESGRTFVVAFPENIAYFHPKKPDNKLFVATLHDDTTVTVQSNAGDGVMRAQSLASGGVLESQAEVRTWPLGNATFLVRASRPVLVYARSRKSSSEQTALVAPLDRLGTRYAVPGVPAIPGTTRPPGATSTLVTERGPFRLVVVNAERDNLVSVTGGGTRTLELKPYEVAQLWVSEGEGGAAREVSAAAPVAVYFGHPCATRVDCTCGLLYTPLPADARRSLTYVVPPAFTAGAVLLAPEPQSLDPASLSVRAAGGAILYRPGLLLSLIPESDFASCYVLQPLDRDTCTAVILVRKGEEGGVHVGADPVTAAWERAPGTDYVSASVSLSQRTAVWHSSSKMAVYYSSPNNGTLVGHPAGAVSKVADRHGCVLTPAVLEVGAEALGWREAVAYCKNRSLELISMEWAELQERVHQQLRDLGAAGELWIGLRRSSVSGEWYWLSRRPVGATSWGRGQPGALQEGQCALLSLEPAARWRGEDCCHAAIPVCYQPPELYRP